nr:tryptophan--tRNA ligase [Candidatus Saccharibacteria bacterium]
MSERIITGLRANGELHLGNYLGALAPMVQLQQKLKDNQELFLFVPDLHSFTTPIDHSCLYENILRNVRLYQAAGINTEHERTVIFRQSFVPAHSELTWILNCFTYFGEAQRMNEFKDKSAKLGNKEVSLGLLDYPVLMSADILLYGAKYVPLGEDQKQHLELTRTLAQRINNKFGDVLTVPETWDKQQEFSSREVSVRIRSLTNPDKKMSKSIDDPKGTIGLLDDPKLAVKKIMSATTDSDENIRFDLKSQPGVSNLLQIGAILSEVNVYEYVKKWHGQKQYGPLKTEVAGLV